MRPLRVVIALLAASEAGGMLFDGTRALVVGDYVTASTGGYAGQLGPWHHLVSAVGIDPRAMFMKSLFAIYGAAWLVVIAAFLLRRRWAHRATIVAALGSLWYVVVGTLTSALVLALLVVLAKRER